MAISCMAISEVIFALFFFLLYVFYFTFRFFLQLVRLCECVGDGIFA